MAIGQDSEDVVSLKTSTESAISGAVSTSDVPWVSSVGELGSVCCSHGRSTEVEEKRERDSGYTTELDANIYLYTLCLHINLWTRDKGARV